MRSEIAQAVCDTEGSTTASAPISLDFEQAGCDSKDNQPTNASNINAFNATEFSALPPQLPASPSVSEWQTADSASPHIGLLASADPCSGTYLFEQRQPGTTFEHPANLPYWQNSSMGLPSRAELFHSGTESYASHTRTATAEDLFSAVTEGNVENIRNVIANMRDINETTTLGSHILFRATMKADNPEVLRLLLDAGADVHAVDVRGNSVMHFWARATGSLERLLPVGKMLLEAGADINAQRSMDGATPLHHVAQAKRRGQICFQKAKFLLENGANTCARLDGTGERPVDLLSTSSQSESTRRFRCLLEFAENSFRPTIQMERKDDW
jgi:hypothetical protein